MRKKIFYTIISCALFMLIWSCTGETPTPNPPVISSPDAVTLSLPADNSACLKGSSETGSTSTLTFTWNKGNYADSYKLEITNLLSKQTMSYTTSNLTFDAVLAVNASYSWQIISVNKSGTATSPKWKFYLSGTPSSNYAPFPAELTAPTQGVVINANGAASEEVSLSWNGSDVDNDIANYTLYLDNKDASTQVVASQTETTAKQTLQSGKTYYWKVITTDKANNKSTSAVSTFQIKQ